MLSLRVTARERARIALAQSRASPRTALSKRFDRRAPRRASSCRHALRRARCRRPRVGSRVPSAASRSRPGDGAAPRRARAPLRVVEQVVLQVRIARHDPDVAEHLEQHPRRAAGAPLGAQRVEQRRHTVLAEQADDDLAVGERRVVVRDLAQARVRATSRRSRFAPGVRRLHQHSVDSTTALQQGPRMGRGGSVGTERLRDAPHNAPDSRGYAAPDNT